MKVLAFGEIVWDIIDGTSHLGGAPLNFAAHVVKCGGKSAILSSVGNDELGTKAISEIQNHNIDTKLINIDTQHATGTVDVFLVNGQPDYTIHENVAFDFIPHINELGNSFDVLYFGSLAQRSEVSRITLFQIIENQEFKYIFYDVNIRKNGYTPEIIKASVSKANILKLNDEEVEIVSMILFDKTLDINTFFEACYNNYNIEVILVTAGEKGCFVYKDGISSHVQGEKVHVMDAVGAGDAFSAAFMTQYFKSGDAIESAKIANMVGGYVASQKGAIPEYSTNIQLIFN